MFLLCGTGSMHDPGNTLIMTTRNSTMRTIMKYAAALTLTGALAVAAATPSQARHWHNGAAIGAGFAAGAIVGAAAVSANDGYNGYYDGQDYAYEPGYAGDYAYEPGPGYSGSRYYRNGNNVNTRDCMGSPGSLGYVPCNKY
jgi:hypothetical protein